MVYFVSAFRVPVLLWTLLIASTSSNTHNGKVIDGGALSRFLKQLIEPYIETNQSITDKPKLKIKNDLILVNVEDLVRLKVIELKPMLQDDEYNDNTMDKSMETDNNIKLEGNDETTIIEFEPKSTRKTKIKSALKETPHETDTFQKKIVKYKQMRKNITKLLDKENTAKSTKKLIRRTLDEMLAQLIERQCSWKDIDTSVLRNHLFGGRSNARKSMKKLKTLSNKDWMSMRKKYEKFLEFHAGKQSEFMSVFQDYFLNFFNDTSNVAKRYKIRCQLIEADDFRDDKTFYRDGNTDSNQCDNFKVCSNELTNFLNTTYNHLNATTVATFRDYAAMYVRDVQEVVTVFGSDVVISILDTISNSAEKATNKIFINKLEQFSLDKNKKKAVNFQLIKNFTIGTTDEIKIALTEIMETELRATQNQLFTTIEGDLNVNLKMEMDNLSRSILDKVCKFFLLCNGRVMGNKKSGRRSFIPDDSENLFVKVQVTFDDELKRSFARMGQKKAWPGDLTRRLIKYLTTDKLTSTTDSSTVTVNNEDELVNKFF